MSSLRLRKVLRSLRRAAQCCDPIADLPGFSRPPARIPMRTLLAEHLDAKLPENEFPWELQNELLIEMTWDRVSHPLTYTSIPIGRKTSLYVEWSENEQEGPCLICAVHGVSPGLAHKAFIRSLFASNGAMFHTGLFGGPPSEVVSSLPRSVLVDSFLAASLAGTEPEQSVFWDQLMAIAYSEGGQRGNVATKTGRKRVVLAYLDAVLS